MYVFLLHDFFKMLHIVHLFVKQKELPIICNIFRKISNISINGGSNFE
jgi:hypothetical protein